MAPGLVFTRAQEVTLRAKESTTTIIGASAAVARTSSSAEDRLDHRLRTCLLPRRLPSHPSPPRCTHGNGGQNGQTAAPVSAESLTQSVDQLHSLRYHIKALIEQERTRTSSI